MFCETFRIDYACFLPHSRVEMLFAAVFFLLLVYCDIALHCFQPVQGGGRVMYGMVGAEGHIPLVTDGVIFSGIEYSKTHIPRVE
jgi:hypothetical protein